LNVVEYFNRDITQTQIPMLGLLGLSTFSLFSHYPSIYMIGGLYLVFCMYIYDDSVYHDKIIKIDRVSDFNKKNVKSAFFLKLCLALLYLPISILYFSLYYHLNNEVENKMVQEGKFRLGSNSSSQKLDSRFTT
jgi:hypothetical protein